MKTYVEREDGTYGWEVESEDKFLGSKVCNIVLRSQNWKGLIWKHRLRLVFPRKVERGYLLLFISGSGAGFEELIFCKSLSDDLEIPCGVLHDVPNQPLFNGLYEDALISFTFSNFIRSGEEDWPLLLPMVKSARRAIDCLEEFLESKGEGLEGLVATGASKRGWTTWLISAVDKRVKAIAPMVFDNLNFLEQMKHQTECYGTYSEQIGNYVDLKPIELLESEIGRRLAEIVDPYSYRERIKIPKLIVNGTNDRYWTVDSLNLYYDDLIGEKHVLYIPNSGHALEDRRRVINSISALTRSVITGSRLPEVKIELEDDDRILRFNSDDEPLYVDLWTASSEGMDFRGSNWASYPVPKEHDSYALPLVGVNKYLGAFAEALYVMNEKTFNLSTKMLILKPQENRI
ncbi:MAG: PhoPQ-activated protein PqaA family protein [Thermoproteota archaeon]